VTGDVDGAKAFFEGRIKVEGDLAAAARLDEMFGARSTL
jgi:putative sterol carrier protein